MENLLTISQDESLPTVSPQKELHVSTKIREHPNNFNKQFVIWQRNSWTLLPENLVKNTQVDSRCSY